MTTYYTATGSTTTGGPTMGWAVGGTNTVTTLGYNTASAFGTPNVYGGIVTNSLAVSHSGDIKIVKGRQYRLEMVDGSILTVDRNGNYKIEDKDAKITYQANNNRDFNQYINASDLLEQFIDLAQKANVSKEDFLKLPLELFINFLIIRAAEQDGDDVPEGITLFEKPALPAPTPQPVLALPAPVKVLNRCKNSGRFIRRDSPVPFSSKADMLAYAEKIAW